MNYNLYEVVVDDAKETEIVRKFIIAIFCVPFLVGRAFKNAEIKLSIFIESFLKGMCRGEKLLDERSLE
jgi:hypothetical protein